MPVTLGLVADDLTGASDTAVQFARRGWTALLALEPAASEGVPVEPHRVLALTTDARALDNSAAETLTADATRQLLKAGVSRLYLKIDSTMRGSVAGQIAGALAAWRARYPNAVAVVCPAYPRMGRTVVANQLLVDARPVHQSSIGRDPVTPVTTSDLARLVPGSTQITPEQLAQNVAPIVTMDAGSDADLATLARAIFGVGPSAIPVGSAGLAEAMAAAVPSSVLEPRRYAPRDIPRNPRILIQVTSLNPVSRAQVARLVNAFPEVVVLLAPPERVGNSSVAERLATTFVGLVEREHWDVLGLVGGDGARAALRGLGASAIRILDSVLEGIPLGVVVGGRADGRTVFTKAGGFGGEDALVRVVESFNK